MAVKASEAKSCKDYIVSFFYFFFHFVSFGVVQLPSKWSLFPLRILLLLLKDLNYCWVLTGESKHESILQVLSFQRYHPTSATSRSFYCNTKEVHFQVWKQNISRSTCEGSVVVSDNSLPFSDLKLVLMVPFLFLRIKMIEVHKIGLVPIPEILPFLLQCSRLS